MNDLKNIRIAVSALPKNGWWNNGIVAYHDNDMMSNGAIPNQELLKKEHEKFKSELENLNNGYEKIIDDASTQIEEFMNKNNFS